MSTLAAVAMLEVYYVAAAWRRKLAWLMFANCCVRN